MGDKINIPEDGAGKAVRFLERTISAETVYVQALVISDPTDPTKMQAVDTTYGAAVDIKRATGMATEAKQDALNASVDGVEALLATIDADTSALAAVDFATGADVAALLTDAQLRATPVPVSVSGGATAANQATEIASLASIDGKTPALGQALAAGSVPVVLTAAQQAALTPPAAITGFATAAKQDVIAGHLDGVEALLGTIDADTGTLAAVDFATGSDVASLAVVGAGLQATAQRVTLASDAALPLPAGAATAAAQATMVGHLDGVEALLGTIDADTSVLAGVDFATGADVAALLTDAQLRATPVPVGGGVAHDGVDSGNPVKIGAKAIAHGTNPTAVAAGDRTDLYANRHGIPFVINGHPNVQTLRVNYTAAQTDAAIISVSPGTKIAVLKVSVLADKANTVDVQARIGFGATVTPTGAGVILTHPGIAAGSGVIEGNGGSLIGVGADGEDLRITSEVPTTGSIDVLVTYYTIES